MDGLLVLAWQGFLFLTCQQFLQFLLVEVVQIAVGPVKILFGAVYGVFLFIPASNPGFLRASITIGPV